MSILAAQLGGSPHLRVELPYPAWGRWPVHGRFEKVGGTHMRRHWGRWLVEIRRRRSRRRLIQVPDGSRLRPGPGRLLRRRVARIEGYGIHAPHRESRAGEGDDRPCPLGTCGETDGSRVKKGDGASFFFLLVCAFLLVGSAIRMSTCKDIALCAPYTSKRTKTRPGEAGGERNRQFGQGEA